MSSIELTEYARGGDKIFHHREAAIAPPLGRKKDERAGTVRRGHNPLRLKGRQSTCATLRSARPTKVSHFLLRCHTPFQLAGGGFFCISVILSMYKADGRSAGLISRQR